MRIRIEGHGLPGARAHASGPRVYVGLQRGRDVVEQVAADAASASWDFECTVRETSDGRDVTGPSVHGRRGDRFVYLSWGVVGDAGEFSMFRRAKLMLAAVPPDVWRAATEGRGTLVGRLGLTDANGGPVCAAVRPPGIAWTLDPAAG